MKWLSEKFLRKYMRLARQTGEDSNPCPSRKIGTVLVRVRDDGDPEKGKSSSSRIVSTGYNGPPRGTPHCDSRRYLEEVFWPQLTSEERFEALSRVSTETLNAFDSRGTCSDEGSDEGVAGRNLVLAEFEGCGICPRRLVGAGSGERTELCSCVHSEANAIVNACEDLHGCWAFCWCGVACQDCTKLLINAGIEKVFFVDDGDWAGKGEGKDYSFASRWLFREAGVAIEVRPSSGWVGEGDGK